MFHLQPPAAMGMAQNCFQQNDSQSSIQHLLKKNSLGPTIVWPHCLGSQTILGVQNNVWVSQWSLLENVWQGDSISKHSVVVLRRCGPPRTSTSDSLSPTLTHPGSTKSGAKCQGVLGVFPFTQQYKGHPIQHPARGAGEFAVALWCKMEMIS